MTYEQRLNIETNDQDWDCDVDGHDLNLLDVCDDEGNHLHTCLACIHCEYYTEYVAQEQECQFDKINA